MQKRILTLTFIFLLSCNKPNPNPELIDPIYFEINSEIFEVQNRIGSAEKELIEAEGELKKVVPQTGRQRYSQDKVFEIKNKIIRLEQLKKYYQIKLESQKIKSRKDYVKAFNEKSVFPNPSRLNEYKEKQKASRMPTNWDSKKRLQEYKDSIANAGKPKAEPGGGGEH